VLDVQELTLVRSGRRILDRVSFALSPGETVALIGANGAGKTSLLESVVGFQPRRTGKVTFDKRPLRSLSDHAAVFSFMPDAFTPPAEVRVREIVNVAVRFGHPSGARTELLLTCLGIGPLMTATAGQLSRGEVRRVALFGALATERPVIVLDEPLGTFDPLQLVDILEFLRGLRTRGQSLLLSVHQLSDAEKIADRVLLLHEGALLASGSPADIAAQAGVGQAGLEQAFLALLRGRRASA
jgi:ABC-2 type transport system ATP-binding protein